MARVLLPALALASSLVGCADNGGGAGFAVVDNTAPTGTTCVFTGDPSQSTLSQGQIYAASPNPYLLTPLLESRISEIAGDDGVRTIQLEGADVTLSQADANGQLTQISQYTSLVFGSILPASYENVSFALVPTSILQMFESSTTGVELAADVTVWGTMAGSRINATPFRYGVTVCNDCIVTNVGDCATFTATVNPGNPCNAYQDGMVSCCTTGSGSDVQLVCPAVQQ